MTSRSADLAVAVVAALARGGVGEVVLSPGSRSSALAVALHQADRSGLLRLHVRIDERSAGFLAVGLAKGTHAPTAVVTTSGTAVANLHPAVLEAAHAGEPVLVLSADRPARLRGTGANQTTYQAGLFGSRVASADIGPDQVDAAAVAIAAAVRRPGPSQVNLQFDDPLLPERLPLQLPTSPDAATAPRPPPWPPSNPSARLELGPRTVVVAGDGAGPPARLLAQEANWPLFAEPTSGARTGTHAVRAYSLLLTGELARQIERVVVTGHPTLSRAVTRLISRGDLEVVSVADRTGTCTDPGRVARRLPSLPTVSGADDPGWLDAWRAADYRVSAAVNAVADGADGLPLRVARCVAEALGPQGLLVVGSSQSPRDLDLMAPVYPAGERRLVLGNRGLAGIDGTVSTAIGAALGRRHGPRALAYLGDLTFLHDANGLFLGPDEPRPDLTMVVANDDGGSIFSVLEPGDPTYREGFERVFGTPVGASLAQLCAASGTPHLRVTTDSELAAVLGSDVRGDSIGSGLRVVEVQLSRSTRRDLSQQLAALAVK